MRIGIDLGGTKIQIIILDQTGASLYQKRLPTPQGNYQKTLETIANLVLSMENELAIQQKIPIGIGIPGAISPTTGRIQNANSICLIDQDLKHDLTTLLNRPIRMANDADCFTLSEATDGAGRNATTVFGVILGTGVGGGIAINKQLVAGPNAITGEWGHNPLPWPKDDERPGRTCYCGQQGCIETFLSGPALTLSDHQLTGKNRTPQAILQATKQGESQAEQLLKRYEEQLARALAGVINILDPHVIVLGGGLSNIQRLYRTIPSLWHPFVFSKHPIKTQLLQARFGDASGVRGAAWLWPEG